MRTGADYRQSVRDGRRIWVMGDGRVDDITTHRATCAMVDEYVAWYDRHADRAWADTVLGKDGTPLSYLVPRSADDLVRMGRCRKAMVRSETPLIAHVDGEFFCLPEDGVHQLEVELLPQALRVFRRLPDAGHPRETCSPIQANSSPA